jgi:isopenicillin N synthase-like dioxygenase
MAFDELVISGTLTLPDILEDSRATLTKFSNLCHLACLTMLKCLSESLKLQGNDRLECYHRHGHLSDSGLKLIYEPSLAKLADVQENRHTDSGTFTLLFYDQWGLHINFKGTEDWAFAAAKPGCVLVNVADSLQRLSNGAFHSPTHRVTQPRDGFSKRYYLSYFSRPEQELRDTWAMAS